MSVLDLLVRAEGSSDLRHYDRPCDVDVLAAAGMVAIYSQGMSLFKLKYGQDATEIDSAKRLFVMWARKAMINRGLDATGTMAAPGKPQSPSASRVGVQALTAWLNDVCPACNGLGHHVVPGTPTLSSKPCGSCGGTGRNRIRQQGDVGEVMKDLMERADSAVVTIQIGIKNKLVRE
jgi:hypothetical protein